MAKPPDFHRNYTEAKTLPSEPGALRCTEPTRPLDALAQQHDSDSPRYRHLAHALYSNTRRRALLCRPLTRMLTRTVFDPFAIATCGAVRSQSFAACDSELSDAALREINAHLHECAACRARLGADALFLRVVRAAATASETAPLSLRERVALALHMRMTENAPA